MINLQSAAFKLFVLSLTASAVVLLVSCYIWTDFEVKQISNVMFWVGAFVTIVGGSNFFPGSKFQGQSEAAMYSLRYKNSSDHRGTLSKKETELTQRMIRGACIALPGLLLVLIALLLEN